MSSGYTTPVVTDATAASIEELHEAVRAFLPTDPESLSFKRAAGGVNNKCTYVYDESGAEKKTFLCRIYNNGFNEKRVAYEHAVLAQLADKKLEFDIPRAMPALKDGSSTYVELSTGAHACFFKCIPGGPPTLAAARSIGKATASLLAAMSDVTVDLPLPNPLYRNFYDAHHKLTREAFFAFVGQKTPELEAVRAPLDFLVSEILKIEQLIEGIMASGGLPEQQIHADLHFDNVLTTTTDAGEQVVTGLLDFEFTAHDWRVMELVVGLSKYVGMKDIEATFSAWVTGYAEGGGRLTQREIELVPDLISLRILNNVAYFVGRAIAGEDSIEPLTGRAEIYANRLRWIEARRSWMVEQLSTKLLQQ